MGLVLQETSEKVLFIKTRQQSQQKDFNRDLMLKLDISSTQSSLNHATLCLRSSYMANHSFPQTALTDDAQKSSVS